MNIAKVQLNNGDSPLTQPLSRRERKNSIFCFNGLHVSPKTLKETHFSERMILAHPAIKEAADKFEVLCTTGKKKYKFRRFGISFSEFNSIIGKIIAKSAILGTAVGGSIALLPDAILSQLPASDLGFPLYGIFAGLITGSFHASWSAFKQSYKKVPELDIKIGQNIEIKDNDIDKAELKGHTSDIDISMRQVGYEGELDLRPQFFYIRNELFNLQNKEENNFKEVLSYFDTDDLFDANNYLKLLKKLKEKCPYDKHLFEHKIDKMGNTMLTAFFDVPLTDKNEKTYDEILDIFSKEPHLDFNQKGYMGVSILEKILISENLKALDFITKKQHMFNYTPELNDIYVNIQDEEFKKKVKNLSFEYKDLTNALLNKSGKSIEKLMPYIEESELLDRLRIQSQVDFVLENRVNDGNFELYMAKNFPQLMFDTKSGKEWRERGKYES